MDIAALYPVAGMSSRFEGRMKWLVRVGPKGERLIEYSVAQALSSGFNKLIFIVSNKTEGAFKEIFRDNYKGVKVYYAFQKFDKENRDKPWGTVDALCSGLEIINSLNCPTVFCNGDDIYGEETFKIIAEHFKNAKISGDKAEDVSVGYKLINVLPEKGFVNRAHFQVNDDYVKDLKEVFGVSMKNFFEKRLKKDSLISMNIFGFLPETVKKLNERLVKFKMENSGSRMAECLLPNEVGELVKQGLKMKIYPTPCKWYGVTNPEDEDVIREALKNEKRFERW